MDGAGLKASRNAGDSERDRMTPICTGACPAAERSRVLNLNGQVQPGLGEGTRKTGSPGIFVPSLNFDPMFAARPLTA